MKLLFFFLVLAGTTFSQTKLIFHKSHSGSASTFTVFTAINPGNFGAAPTVRVQHAVLDTLKYLPDGKVVMITSEYCTREMRMRDLEQQKQENRHDFDPREQRANLWKAGRDTLVNHSLFSRRHELDNIKDSLENNYYFRNNIDSVVFIGYDNHWTKWRRKVERKKGMLLPSGNGGGSGGSLLILTFVAAFLVSAFLFSLRKKLV